MRRRGVSKRSRLGVWTHFLGTAIATFGMAQPPAMADTGQLQASEISGPFGINLYTSPVPLRAGEVEISALVTNAEDGAPALGAVVTMELRREGADAASSAKLEASRGGDGLRYFVTTKVQNPGRWAIRVEVANSLGEGSLLKTVQVDAALPMYITLWPALVFPPVVIALFVLNQRLRVRMRRGNRIQSRAKI